MGGRRAILLCVRRDSVVDRCWRRGTSCTTIERLTQCALFMPFLLSHTCSPAPTRSTLMHECVTALSLSFAIEVPAVLIRPFAMRNNYELLNSGRKHIFFCFLRATVSTAVFCFLPSPPSPCAPCLCITP